MGQLAFFAACIFQASFKTKDIATKGEQKRSESNGATGIYVTAAAQLSREVTPQSFERTSRHAGGGALGVGVKLGMPKYVAVWIDHKEANIFEIHPDKVDKDVVLAPHHVHHKHPRGPEGAHNHPEDAKHFFHEVARSLEGSDEVLLVGPSTAKLEFLRHVQEHDHALGPKIVGIETVDHPTDGQLVAYAKTYFKRTDRMH